jgi:hypothetical protein
MSARSVRPRTVRFPADSNLKSCTIDPGEYVSARLIGELADGWKGMSEEFQLAAGTISHRASAIRALGRFLTDQSDKFLTLRASGPEVSQRLHEWETTLIKSYSQTSTTPKRFGYDIRGAVAYFLESNELNPGVITDWAASPVLDGRPFSALPLDEFTNSERKQLESACRAIVRETEARIRQGDRLLEKGRDPRSYGWHRLENVVWALRHLPFEESFHQYLIGSQRGLNPEDVDRITRVYRAPGRRHPAPLSSAVGALLVPDPQFLLAVRILVHLQTGWSPEETLNLSRRDVEFGCRSVRVRTPKHRAHRVRWRTLEITTEKAVGWKAGDLFQRAANVMRHAHALTPDKTAFWMTAARTTRDRGNYEYPSWIIRPHTFANVTFSLAELVRRRDLDISKPHDMRRLRKTVKSARAVLLGTLNGASGDDHTIEVFQNHYAQTTTVKTISAQTIMRVQGKILNRATQGPALILHPAQDVAELRNGDIEIRELATQVAAETPIEQELSISTCRNPWDGPLSERGMLCHASPSMCLQCGNAVIFPEHLPRLLAYEVALQSIKKSMPPVAYAESYGQQCANLQAIIEKFTPDQIEKARTRPTLHRPLGQRAEQ